MILAIHNIEKSFGEHVIVNNGSFHIEDREKVALIGINGAGKTTILRMIVGEEPMDGGRVIMGKGKTLGYLAQQQKITSGNTIWEEVSLAKADILELEAQIRDIEIQLKSLSSDEQESRLKTYHQLVAEFEHKNGYAYKSEVTGVLKGLGFSEEDFNKNTDILSGGQRTRVALGRMLLSSPDILILDEPTNHLDLNSTAWLENYLVSYQGAVLIVSHDRYFLNKVVTKIVEIDNTKINMFSGNYQNYANKKQMLRDAELNHYLNQQREIKRQEAVITKLKQFNREKSIRRAESREKVLAKMDVLDKPVEVKNEMRLRLEPRITSGNDVLTMEGISKSFGSLNLFDNACFEIKRGEHVAIIGDNGTGKTTLLKIINQILPPDTGLFTLGTKVQIGYYDQEHDILDLSKNIFDEISDTYPDLSNTKIRSTLAAFHFTGEDVFKNIEDLSGGEKGRVSLAKLMLSEANFLILDEPTNHLDITSKEILEHALNTYEGTLLYVSHDRYFINRTATRILELTKKSFISYFGNYDYYLEKKEHYTKIYTSNKDEDKDNQSKNDLTKSRQSWQEQKEKQAKERKRLRDLKQTENRIHFLEDRNKEIDEQLTQEDIFTNPIKCQELTSEKEDHEQELHQLYETWDELSDK